MVQGVVDCMVAMVPSAAKTPQIDGCLNQMVDACISLTVQCSKEGVVQVLHQEKLACQVVQAAYEVAKGAKQLMVLIQM